MDRWTELQAFVRIAEARSMTCAAAELNLSVSGISRHLMSLETQLGARLVQRSTRQLSLTSEGETLFAEALELLANWEAAEANVSAKAHTPTGRLRVGASLSFSLLHLMPVVAQFRRLYPAISIEIVSSNRYYDIIENGLDLAIRTRRVSRWIRRPVVWVDIVVLATLLAPTWLVNLGFLRILRLWTLSQKDLF